GALRDYLEGREITITTKATADFFSESVGKVVEEVASAKAAVKEITKEDYLMLKEQGKSDKEISKLYGFSHNTMNQRKKSWGLVDLPKVSPKRKVPAPQQEKEKAPAGSGSAEVKSFEIRLFKLQNDLEQKEKENEALRNLVLVLFDKK
ncbi:MAG TPA: hypothetical protein VK253_02910, partial [Candidatus Binatia bacterium]|nr:hypothetical protein [Candidatus Binatia bacterium]